MTSSDLQEKCDTTSAKYAAILDRELNLERRDFYDLPILDAYRIVPVYDNGLL